MKPTSEFIADCFAEADLAGFRKYLRKAPFRTSILSANMGFFCHYVSNENVIKPFNRVQCASHKVDVLFSTRRGRLGESDF